MMYMLFAMAMIVPDTTKRPQVSVEETILDTMTIVVVRDTASSAQDVSRVIGAAYGELFTCINQQGLIPGKVMAFYHTNKPPFIMEVAVEVNKVPAQLSGRVKVNKVYGGNAVVVKYKGPYEKIEMAYRAMTDWMKQHNKEARGYPFEVYLNDPATVKDPYDLRTDVYQLLKN